MPNAAQRYETVNDLYYRATGRMRPGKDVPPACGYDSSSEENQARFENWVATSAFTDAVDRIAELEASVTKLGSRIDDLEERLGEP
jgi:hypothetical protein